MTDRLEAIATYLDQIEEVAMHGMKNRDGDFLRRLGAENKLLREVLMKIRHGSKLDRHGNRNDDELWAGLIATNVNRRDVQRWAGWADEVLRGEGEG